MFFNKKNLLTSCVVFTIAAMPLMAKTNANTARIVDFGKCYTDSQYGKREQENFNQMKNQMEAAIKELSDQMTEASAKLDDEFTRDSLSPEAEKKLQEEMQTLSSELQRYQQQYYYMLQQANMKTMNTMADRIKEASGSIAKDKHYSLIVNKDQVFHFTPDLEITGEVIIKLDELFNTETANMEKVKAELSKKGAAK